MNGGTGQMARVQASVGTVGLYADRLPARDVESEAVKAWRAVDMLSTSSPHQLRHNLTALIEMRELLDRMIEATR